MTAYKLSIQTASMQAEVHMHIQSHVHILMQIS